MARQEKYRFYLINGCEVQAEFSGIAYGALSPELIIIIGPHDIQAGDWVKLVGFKPLSANIITQVISVEAENIHVAPIPGMDTSDDAKGTIQWLVGKKYITPMNFYNTKFIWERQGDSVRFRKKLAGKLKFDNPNCNNDYTYFIDYVLSNPCCEIKFVVEKRCDGEWVTEFNGYFSHNNCRWNLSQCWVEVEIEADDVYRCIEANKGVKHNLLLTEGIKEATVPYEITYEELECCDDKGIISAGPSGECPSCDTYIDAIQVNDTINEDVIVLPCDAGTLADWQIKCNVTVQLTHTGGGAEDFHVCTTYIREIAKTIDIGGVPFEPEGTGWIESDAITIGGLPGHKWYRKPYDGAYQTHDNYTIYWDCGTCTKSQCWNDPSQVVTYGNGRLFYDAFSYLVQQTCADIIGVCSDFFQLNAPGDTPGYVEGTNYVTGDPNKVANMLVYQMSDFANPTADEAATLGDITFEQWMAALITMFNVDWFVDADGYVRIEHISWFSRTAAINTTTGINKKRNEGKKEFYFDKPSIPSREVFEFDTQGTIDFVGKPIIYFPPCPNEVAILNRSAAPFSTDTRWIQNNPSQVNLQTGFVLIVLDPDLLPGYTIDKEVGLLTGIDLNNAHLSWANLHDKYHRHNRWLIEGNMNAADETFESAIRTKRQVPIGYDGGCCASINPLTDLVTTELGDGQIDKMEKSNRDELFIFDLLF